MKTSALSIILRFTRLGGAILPKKIQRQRLAMVLYEARNPPHRYPHGGSWRSAGDCERCAVFAAIKLRNYPMMQPVSLDMAISKSIQRPGAHDRGPVVLEDFHILLGAERAN
jgi:hypothetical protein